MIEKHIIVDCTSKVFLIGRFEIDLKKAPLETSKTVVTIPPKTIPEKDTRIMSRQQVAVPLKEVFEMKNWSKRLKLTVKILKKLSENEFLVADSTISCKIKIDNLKPIYIAKSSVFNIPKFEKVHDGVKPFLPSPSLPGPSLPSQVCPKPKFAQTHICPNPNLPGPIFAPIGPFGVPKKIFGYF